jgi:hypothetical protein
MRPEDLNDVLAKALEEFGATTEEERERFARLQERMRETNEEIAREIEEARQLTQQLSVSSRKAFGANRRRGEIAEEIVSELTGAFSEHSDLIQRIAGR